MTRINKITNSLRTCYFIETLCQFSTIIHASMDNSQFSVHSWLRVFVVVSVFFFFASFYFPNSTHIIILFDKQSKEVEKKKLSTINLAWTRYFSSLSQKIQQIFFGTGYKSIMYAHHKWFHYCFFFFCCSNHEIFCVWYWYSLRYRRNYPTKNFSIMHNDEIILIW